MSNERTKPTNYIENIDPTKLTRYLIRLVTEVRTEGELMWKPKVIQLNSALYDKIYPMLKKDLARMKYEEVTVVKSKFLCIPLVRVHILGDNMHAEKGEKGEVNELNLQMENDPTETTIIGVDLIELKQNDILTEPKE